MTQNIIILFLIGTLIAILSIILVFAILNPREDNSSYYNSYRIVLKGSSKITLNEGDLFVDPGYQVYNYVIKYNLSYNGEDETLTRTVLVNKKE